MKDHGISPPATSLPANWTSVLLGGVGLLGILPLFLNHYMTKDRKMTKLEKACVAFVIALSERLQETEKRNADLSKELGESVSKERHDALTRRAEELDRNLTAMTDRAERAEAKLAEVPAAAPTTRGSRGR